MVQRAGIEAGRTVLAAPSGSTLAFPVQPLVPGASFAVGYSSGAISAGAIGTVTYRDGQTVYGFGHPLDGAGRRSLIQDAYVYYVVNNPNVDQSSSYKLAAPGHIEGTLTSDTPNAVLAMHSQVADETDIGMPLGSSLIDLVVPLQLAQAATEIYNGAPANESGHMCPRRS